MILMKVILMYQLMEVPPWVPSKNIKLNPSLSTAIGDISYSIKGNPGDILSDAPDGVNSSGAILHPNSNNGKYKYKYGLYGSIGLGTKIDSFRVDVEGLYFFNRAEDEDNGKIHDMLMLKGVTVLGLNGDIDILNGTEESDNNRMPFISNEDGFSTVAAMFTPQIGGPLNDEIALYGGIGIGYAGINALGVKLLSWAWQCRADAEIMTSNGVTVSIVGRYFKVMNDEFSNVLFSTSIDDFDLNDNGADVLTGGINIPVHLIQNYSTWSIGFGVKFEI